LVDELGRVLNYRLRLVDSDLQARLRATGAVLIEGARGCGKTQTGLRAAKSAVRLDRDRAAREAAELDPSLVLRGMLPRLIDEWQLVDGIWNEVRSDVDDHPEEPGRYILAGSAVPPDDATRHTGALRITRMRMRPMSLAESGHSSAEVSLAGLLLGQIPSAGDPGIGLRELTERLVVGGWPALLSRDPDDALVATQGYLEETRRLDLARLEGPKRDPENVERVLRSLARHTATAASASTIAADVVGSDGRPINYHTVLDYVAALTRVFVVEDLPPWSPALRSRSVLRSSPIRHFVDPSLAAAALGAGPDRLLGDPRTLGFLFKSLVVRDLRIYAQATKASVWHYRDNTGAEADAVVQTADGRWGAIEVKLGTARVDDAAASLIRVAAHVDQERHGPPAFLAVITSGGYAYRREDGVLVVPITTLGA
jgi:uncharacterized protein